MKPLFTCGLFVVAVGFSSNNGDLCANPLTDKRLHENSVERFVAVYSYVADLPSKAVESTLKGVTQNTRQKLSFRVKNELQIALLQRLTKEKPNVALEFALDSADENRKKFVKTVFDSWSMVDLEAVITHAKDLNWSDRNQAMESIVRANLEMPLDSLRDISERLNLDKKRAVEYYQLVANVELIEDPKTAWYGLAEMSKQDIVSFSDNYNGLLSRLAIQWFKQDGFAVLDEIHEVPKEVYYTGYSFGAILKFFAQESPRLAFEYLLDRPKYQDTLEAVLLIWFKQDRSAAIKAVEEIGSNDVRYDLQYELAWYWASLEPRYILQNLDDIPEDVRDVAAGVGVATIAHSSLHEAGAYAMQIEDSSLRTLVVRQLLPIWSEQEPHTLLDWILKDSSNTGLIDEIREQLVYNTLESDPVRAFKLARDHPIVDWERGWGGRISRSQLMIPSDTPAVGLEAQIFDDISRIDLDLARELLVDVREGITKRVAMLQVGRALRYRGDVQEAIDLAQEFPETEKDWYFSLIIYDWIDGDPSGLADEISTFPTVDLRSTVAHRLLRWNRRYDKLTDKQIESLEKHLTEDDVDQLYFQW